MVMGNAFCSFIVVGATRAGQGPKPKRPKPQDYFCREEESTTFTRSQDDLNNGYSEDKQDNILLMKDDIMDGDRVHMPMGPQPVQPVPILMNHETDLVMNHESGPILIELQPVPFPMDYDTVDAILMDIEPVPFLMDNDVDIQIHSDPVPIQMDCGPALVSTPIVCEPGHSKSAMLTSHNTKTIGTTQTEKSCLPGKDAGIEVSELERNGKRVVNFKCGICGRDFKRKSHLAAHHSIHTGERPYSCPVCGKLFRLKATMRKHSQSHDTSAQTRESIHSNVCIHCKRTFATGSSLKRHKKGVRTSCPLSSKNRSALESHLLKHPKKKPELKCSQCPRKFKHPQRLRSHIRAVHSSNSIKFPCFHCTKLFTCTSKLIRHVEVAHSSSKIRWKCEQCSMVFAFEKRLMAHMKQCHSHP